MQFRSHFGGVATLPRRPFLDTDNVRMADDPTESAEPETANEGRQRHEAALLAVSRFPIFKKSATASCGQPHSS
ncbi:hypothetical protein SBA6_670018 [Candidatus Sulfopaludibacter sp. SbA6]|nr:hypothetical protein SBA6_670018 [Candidatus Sulfopaludibacter sp. SbA6]